MAHEDLLVHTWWRPMRPWKRSLFTIIFLTFSAFEMTPQHLLFWKHSPRSLTIFVAYRLGEIGWSSSPSSFGPPWSCTLSCIRLFIQRLCSYGSTVLYRVLSNIFQARSQQCILIERPPVCIAKSIYERFFTFLNLFSGHTNFFNSNRHWENKIRLKGE